METQFQNLTDFLYLFEFCPICRKRLAAIVSFPYTAKCSLDNKFLTINFNSATLSINLYNNKIHHKNDINLQSFRIVAGMRCKKFHFFYIGSCFINYINACLENISLTKIHFTRVHFGNEIFVVNNYFDKNLTSVSLTKEHFSQEFSLPLIDFNFSSKKKIDKHLKTIKLLR